MTLTRNSTPTRACTPTGAGGVTAVPTGCCEQSRTKRSWKSSSPTRNFAISTIPTTVAQTSSLPPPFAAHRRRRRVRAGPSARTGPPRAGTRRRAGGPGPRWSGRSPPRTVPGLRRRPGPAVRRRGPARRSARRPARPSRPVGAVGAGCGAPHGPRAVRRCEEGARTSCCSPGTPGARRAVRPKAATVTSSTGDDWVPILVTNLTGHAAALRRRAGAWARYADPGARRRRSAGCASRNCPTGSVRIEGTVEERFADTHPSAAAAVTPDWWLIRMGGI